MSAATTAASSKSVDADRFWNDRIDADARTFTGLWAVGRQTLFAAIDMAAATGLSREALST